MSSHASHATKIIGSELSGLELALVLGWPVVLAAFICGLFFLRLRSKPASQDNEAER